MTQPLTDEELIDLAHSRLLYNAPLSPSRAADLLDRGLPGATGKLLDIGCGDGRFLLDALAGRPGWTGDGVDLNARAINRAQAVAQSRGLSERANFHVADINDWGAVADTVVCVGTAHAWPDRAAGFTALRERTRAGGRLVYGDGFWRSEPSSEAVEIFGELNTLGELVQLGVDAGWRPLHVAEATPDELDTWESDWRAGLELSGHPQALELAEERRREYFGIYRGVFGFAWMVLTPAIAPG
jgi:cyclopropane fatty-acyl-phospholipid synthase-like methyltransferase